MLNFELDEVLHQANRTRIMTYLASFGKTDFTTLKKALNLSDGQMTSHMRVLLAAEYVLQDKFFEKNKPRTEYQLSELGKERFNLYLETLKQIVQQSSML